MSAPATSFYHYHTDAEWNSRQMRAIARAQAIMREEILSSWQTGRRECADILKEKRHG